MTSYPNPAAWEHANQRQAERAARSFDIMRRRAVPAYPGPLFVDDEDEAKVPQAGDVARRTLALWAVELRAEGMPQADALELVMRLNLESSLSPSEAAFLNNPAPDPEECYSLVWRLESIWVMLWAMGMIDELNWPAAMCDVPKLVGLMKPLERDPEWIRSIGLRRRSELLDAQDLTMRINWAIRDSYANRGGRVPEDLDWSGGSRLVSIESCVGVAVVAQRHHALNWLVGFLDPAHWDEVETPT